MGQWGIFSDSKNIFSSKRELLQYWYG